MEIVLKSKPLKVVKILKQSKARMFENVEVGDILQISVPVECVGTSRGRSYAVDILVENLSKVQDRTYKTFNELPRLLKNLKLEEM